jgi:hypothetical protein
MDPLLIFIFIGFIILFRLAAGHFDSIRIKEEVTSKGGQLISKVWSPFGKGWLGEKNSRIYKIEYLDRDGNHRQAFVKTSALGGVYFNDDKIINYAKANQSKPIHDSMDLTQILQ